MSIRISISGFQSFSPMDWIRLPVRPQMAFRLKGKHTSESNRQWNNSGFHRRVGAYNSNSWQSIAASTGWCESNQTHRCTCGDLLGWQSACRQLHTLPESSDYRQYLGDNWPARHILLYWFQQKKLSSTGYRQLTFLVFPPPLKWSMEKIPFIMPTEYSLPIPFQLLLNQMLPM